MHRDARDVVLLTSSLEEPIDVHTGVTVLETAARPSISPRRLPLKLSRWPLSRGFQTGRNPT